MSSGLWSFGGAKRRAVDESDPDVLRSLPIASMMHFDANYGVYEDRGTSPGVEVVPYSSCIADTEEEESDCSHSTTASDFVLHAVALDGTPASSESDEEGSTAEDRLRRMLLGPPRLCGDSEEGEEPESCVEAVRAIARLERQHLAEIADPATAPAGSPTRCPEELIPKRRPSAKKAPSGRMNSTDVAQPCTAIKPSAAKQQALRREDVKASLRAQRELLERVANEKQLLKSELLRLRHTQSQVMVTKDSMEKAKYIPNTKQGSRNVVITEALSQPRSPPPSNALHHEDGAASPDSQYVPPQQDGPSPNDKPEPSVRISVEAVPRGSSLPDTLARRAEERAAARAELKAKYAKQQEEKYLLAMQAAEDEAAKALDDKKRRAIERRRKMEEEQRQLRKAEESQRFQAMQRAKAIDHYNRALLRHRGMLPWMRYVQSKRHRVIQLQDIRRRGILHHSFQQLLQHRISRKQQKGIAAVLREMQLVDVARKYWKRCFVHRWKTLVYIQKQEIRIAEGYRCRTLLRRWQDKCRTKQANRDEKNWVAAVRHHRYRATRSTFSRWTSFVQENKDHRCREAVRSRLWQRAQAVLSSSS